MLIAKVLRELVTKELFREYADVKDALRRRLSALKIRYRPSEFDAAQTIVASNTPLVREERKVLRPVSFDPANQGLSKAETAAVMAQVRARLQTDAAAKSMPTVRRITARRADQFKARQMIAAEILESVRRCEALEAELNGD